MAFEVTIAAANVIDDGNGIARIDSRAIKTLNLEIGDVIKIEGRRRSTAAIVQKVYQQDEGLDFIRIDGWIRENIEAGIGDRVLIDKTNIKSGKKVILSPPSGQKVPITPDLSEFIKTKLKNKPLVQGDVFPLAIFGSVFRFIVVKVDPEGVVMFTKDTEILLKSASVSEFEIYGNPKEILSMLRYAVTGNLEDSKKELNTLILVNRLSFKDILTMCSEELQKLKIEDRRKLKIIDEISNCDFRITQGANMRLQLEGLLARIALIEDNDKSK